MSADGPCWVCEKREVGMGDDQCHEVREESQEARSWRIRSASIRSTRGPGSRVFPSRTRSASARAVSRSGSTSAIGATWSDRREQLRAGRRAIDRSAQAQMAHLLAKTARLGPGDAVLDCGFGYGDQDIIWAEEYRPARIVGLNVTPNQVRIAPGARDSSPGSSRWCAWRWAPRRRFRPGRASSTSSSPLESAMHFNTQARVPARGAPRAPPGWTAGHGGHGAEDRSGGWRGAAPPLRYRYKRGRIAFLETNVWTTQRSSGAAVGGLPEVKVESSRRMSIRRPMRRFTALYGSDGGDQQPAQGLHGPGPRECAEGPADEARQYQWQSMFNCDDYVVIYAEKP